MSALNIRFFDQADVTQVSGTENLSGDLCFLSDHVNILNSLLDSLEVSVNQREEIRLV